MITVWSSDAEARYLLSWDHVTSDIPALCPVRVQSYLPVMAVHNLMVQSFEAVARRRPSGEN